MATVNEKMTSIADKIRSLTGQTDKLSLDAMDTNLETANTDKATMIATLEELGITVDANASLSDIATSLTDDIDNEVGTQADLISQIATALEGKAGGSGGINTCTLTIEPAMHGGYAFYTTVDNDNIVSKKQHFDGSTNVSIRCVCGSLVAVGADYCTVVEFSDNLTPMEVSYGLHDTYFAVNANPGDTATIILSDAAGGNGSE